MTAPITIVFPVFPGVTQLDFTGPYQVLVRTPVSSSGLTFSELARLEDVERCDVICVPGGNVVEAMLNKPLVANIRRLALGARYVTSVCTGSLILGAAGVLHGKRSACHWAYRDLLPIFGAIPDPARVVRDGNFISGGGVTAGIDFALTLAAELTDAPAPPLEAGRPDIAPGEVLSRVQERYAGMLAPHRAVAEQIAAANRRDTPL
ncbi:MAG: DJ-1/PfpI family protein [Alphaproteobacteria bacterium]|nr:MAG: DJ-1/PfpI family protein [Alphaproteobacteria bacterium]